MSTSSHIERPVLVSAVRELIRAARSERAGFAMAAPEREFYLGVEAAAEEVLRPELAAARPPGWPQRETPRFRDGYLQAAASLAAAMSAPEPPLRLRLPAADVVPLRRSVPVERTGGPSVL